MSSDPQFQNYSQINLDAIKNTKLFQKFMQNKSGLIANNRSTNLNKERQSRKQVLKQQSEIVQKKWTVNRNKQKAITLANQLVGKSQQQGQFDNDNERQEKGFVSHHELRNSRNERQFRNERQPQDHRQIENHQYAEISYVEPYRKPVLGINERVSKMQKAQNTKSYNQQITSNQIEQPFKGQQSHQDSHVSQNRRKRNFNPNFQADKEQSQLAYQSQLPSQHQPTQQTKMTYQTLSNSYNSRPAIITQSDNHQNNLSKVHRLNNVLQQALPENNFNYYNTSTEQRYSKPQISFQRNQPANNLPITQKSNQYQLSSSSSNVPFSQNQYRQKYQFLLRKHQQLKHEFKNENKNRKKEFTEWQHEIEIIKEKLFDVQSREDSLLIENQRLKDKCESQNLIKMKTQEENKELGYKIKELEDQLSMKQNAIKQRFDQTNYWKAQVDAMKQDLNSVRLTLEKRNDQYNLLYGDYQITRKERDNKDFLLEDLRRNISSLVEQNSAAKDELFKLVTKLYQMEQQNQILRNDLKRQQFDNTQLNTYMKDLQQQPTHIARDRIQSTIVERPHDRYQQMRIERQAQKNQSFIVKQQTNRSSLTEQERPNMEKQTRRRGQFARERGQLTKNQRPQRDERPLPTTQNAYNMSVNEQRSFNQPKQSYQNNNKMQRIHQISEELDKIKDMKAMNGAIRRRKIDLERELQQLESQ